MGAYTEGTTTRASRRIATYANAVARWRLAEAAGPWPNSGSGAAGSMVVGGSVANVITNVRAPLQRGHLFPGAINSWTAAPANGSRPGETSGVLSVSAWFVPRSWVAGHLCGKKYKNDATWGTPTVTVCLSINVSGFLEFQLTTGAAGAGTKTLLGATKAPLTIGDPWLCAGVYDGAFMRVVLNGMTIASVAKTGAIDFGGSGGDGDFHIGCPDTANATSTNSCVDGLLEEVVYEDVIVSDDTYRERYLRGIGLHELEAG